MSPITRSCMLPVAFRRLFDSPAIDYQTWERRVALALALVGVLAVVGCRRDESELQTPGRSEEKTEIESAAEVRRFDLQSEQPVEVLAGPKGAVATLELQIGQALMVIADQQEVDVVLEVRLPAGPPVVGDLPTRQTAPEVMCFVAESSGRHELVVRNAAASKERPTKLESRIEPATASHRACASALTGMDEGKRHERQGEAEKAYASYRIAAQRAAAAGEPILEASALLLGLEVAIDRSAEEALADAVSDGKAALDAIAGAGLSRFEILLKQRIAEIEIFRGDLEPSRSLLVESLEQAKRIEDTPGMARAHFGLGQVAQIHSDLTVAADAYREALALWKLDDRPAEHALTLVWLATVHTVRSDLGTARDLLSEADRMLPPNDTATRLEVRIQAGWIEFLETHYEAAIDAYEQALRLLPPAKHSLARGSILDRMASAERGRGNYDRAEALYKETLGIYRYAGRPFLAQTIYSLGELYTQQGRLGEARPLLEEAIEVFRSVEDDNALAHVLTTLSDLEHASGNLDGAMDRLDEAAERFETRWRSAFRKGDLARPTAMVQDIDAKYVELLMERFETRSDEAFARRAFVRSDRARDRNLLALIGSGIGPAWKPTPAEQAARSRLHEAIERLESRRSEDREVPQIESELRHLQLDLDATEREIRSRILDQHPGPARLDSFQLQRELPEGTCVLSYVLGASRSYLFLLCPDRFETVLLPPREILEVRAGQLLTALFESNQRGTEDQTSLLLRSVSRELLGPIRRDLIDLRRLIVVAEGTLAHLPFGALPDPAAWGVDDAPLLARIDVTQGPSVGVLAELARRAAARPGSDGRIVAFADPVYSANDRRLDKEARKRGAKSTLGTTRYWPRLPATRDEALAIKSLAPEAASISLDFDASRKAVLDGALEHASIIHFASHTDLDEALPVSSGLVLSQFDEKGRAQPSHLRIREIRSLDLEAELVVLSACQSGWNKTVRGDALTGLAQAFFAAGASRVIVSLWPVEDRATAALIQSFYHHLLVEKAEPGTALRRAQMALRESEEWRSPFYWAGFVLLGGWC